MCIMYDGSFPAAVSSCGLCPFSVVQVVKRMSLIFIAINCTV